MARYLVLLPAPEEEWAQLPPEDHEKGMRAHERFSRELAEGGHRVVVSNPLTPSSEALSMRPDGQGRALVTQGPYLETTEQIVGFYLIETDDADGLRRCCEQLASTGDHIELRRLAEHSDERAVNPEP